MVKAGELLSRGVIIFLIPPYSEQSAGIVTCHELADRLGKSGYEVEVAFFETLGKFKEKGRSFCYKVKEWGEVEGRDAIYFYPEVVSGNPLKAKKVVRLMLNRDGLLQGTKVGRADNEFIVSFSRSFEEGDFLLRDFRLPTDVFNLEDALPYEERKLSVVYAGKGGEYIAPEGIEPSVLMMSRNFGMSEDVAWVLKRAKVLYTADSMCMLNHEALLCGCAPVITKYGDWSEEELLRYEFPEVYEMNRDGDFSPSRIIASRGTLLERAERYRREYPAQLDEMMGKIEAHFSKKLVTV